MIDYRFYDNLPWDDNYYHLEINYLWIEGLPIGGLSTIDLSPNTSMNTIANLSADNPENDTYINIDSSALNPLGSSVDPNVEEDVLSNPSEMLNFNSYSDSTITVYCKISSIRLDFSSENVGRDIEEIIIY